MNWQTLAPELIFEILSKFLPGLTLPVVEPEFFPWYLGHICSSWRTVFKSSPQFWSAFVIGLDRDADRYFDRALLLTEMCIQQSQKHPLTFQFKFDGGRDFEFSRCHKLLKALMAQSTRWLDAYFYLPRREASILHAVKTQLPILRAFRLTYSSYSESYGQDLPKFDELFENAPYVRRVRIVDYPAWKLDWSSITTLHLEFTYKVQLESLANLLQTIKHLEELYLEFLGDTSSASPPRISLPFLKRLGISTMENLVLFETPALEEFYIKSLDLTHTEYYESVRKLLGPLNHLKKLALLLADIDMAILSFQYLPDTQNIDFYVRDLSILKILPLCPSARHLETMTVGVISYSAPTLREFLDILNLWRTQSNSATGFGPFEGLKRFTLKLKKGSRYYTQVQLDRFESEFTNLFSERGVQCTINQVRNLDENNVAVPPFDIFWGQEADYLLL